MSKQTFLVVDDDPIALEVARERLEQLGFKVETRLNALGTSGWIAINRPDFVLLDVMMPALSGSELAKVVRRREVHTRIILHSSKSRPELEALVRQTGALGAITKDCDAEQFSSHLRRLISEASRSPRLEVKP
jgi:DNA-binding response OmpR family regulator